MKILQLTVHFSPNVGGVETHLDDLVNGLIEKNHNVFVLTYKPLKVTAKSKIWEEGDGKRVLRIPWIKGLFYKLVKNPILEFMYLLPGLFLATPFVLLYFHPQVIQTHGLVAGFLGVFWGKIFGIRTITTTHSMYNFPKSGLYHDFAKWIFSNSNKVLTLSKLSKKEIEGLGVNKDDVQVFTYWIDLKKFTQVKEAKIKVGWEKKFVVLYVGRLVEEKGILVLLESLKLWNKKIYLAVIGTGPLEEKIKEHTSKFRNLIFLGKIDNDKLPLYYSASDVTIVPSIHDEGFGRVILESLACETAVIAANRGAISEAMDETVGRLIDVEPLSIQENVNHLFTNKKILTDLSKNASVYAKKRYSSLNLETILKNYE